MIVKTYVIFFIYFAGLKLQDSLSAIHARQQQSRIQVPTSGDTIKQVKSTVQLQWVEH